MGRARISNCLYNWNEYLDTYFEHDVIRKDDGSVVAKTYRDGAFEDLEDVEERQFEPLWARVQVPTLLLPAGHAVLIDNDQLLPEESAAAIQSTITELRQQQWVIFDR